MEALITLGRREKVGAIFLHPFLDGRDTPPTSGERFLLDLEAKIKPYPEVRIATLSGRYYAMDRDKRWERTEKVYLALTEGAGVQADSPLGAIRKSYESQVTDEFVVPTVIRGCVPEGMVRDGDAVIFFNFRADRARQLTRAFTEKEFKEFARMRLMQLSAYVTMTEYDKKFGLPAAFPPRELTNILGEVASRREIHQLRIAETEKYAHVTYFFNGGEEKQFPLEERMLIPSARDVPTYDLKPEMKAYEVTAKVIEQIQERRYGLVILNYANADMVGHTGNFEATIRACEVVDECVGKVAQAAHGADGRVIITADHGNAEQMLDYDTGQIHTAHTSNPVPLILIDEELRSRKLRAGTAIDVAPTILGLMGIEPPREMTGRSLIEE
jgi:2,3-bisphosphoglycerate-independent phosphoglycerate mutase